MCVCDVFMQPVRAVQMATYFKPVYEVDYNNSAVSREYLTPCSGSGTVAFPRPHTTHTTHADVCAHGTRDTDRVLAVRRPTGEGDDVGGRARRDADGAPSHHERLPQVSQEQVRVVDIFFLLFSLSFADDEDDADDGGCDVDVFCCSKPTVNTAELQKQIKFTEEFGQEG